MRKATEEEWKKCAKCGKRANQIKVGRKASGTQRCKCKECGIVYTINPKQHAYPEETRKLAIKMYYGEVSGRGVGKILGINKSNGMNWIKKRTRRKSRRICQKKRGRAKKRNGRAGRAVLGCKFQTSYRNTGERLYYNDGQSYCAADRQSCCK